MLGADEGFEELLVQALGVTQFVVGAPFDDATVVERGTNDAGVMVGSG